MRELLKELLRAVGVALLCMALASVPPLISRDWWKHPVVCFWVIVGSGIFVMFVMSIDPILNWRHVFAWGHMKEHDLSCLYWDMRKSRGSERDAYAKALRSQLPPHLRGTWDNDSRGLNPEERDTL